MTHVAIGAEPTSTYLSTRERYTKEFLMQSAASNVPSGGQEQSSSDLVAAVSELVAAIRDEGSHPKHHRMMIVRLRNEWPVLWRAIDRIDKLTPRP